MPAPLRRFSLIFVCALVLAYCGAAVFVYSYQDHFIFFPSASVIETPAHYGAQFQDVRIPLGDAGPTLAAWWIGAENAAQDRPRVLLYLHGNYGNIGANAEHAVRLSRYGVSVLLPDYRGYGQSSGPFPAEGRVYEDAEAAWTWLVHEKRFSPSQIFLYGHSLGGAIAIHLARQHPDAAGLIVESSFTSMTDMAHLDPKLRILPMSVLLTSRFDSIGLVDGLKMPLLLIHGTADAVVPAYMARRLYAMAPQPSTLLLIDGAGHTNCAAKGGEQYKSALERFLHPVP